MSLLDSIVQQIYYTVTQIASEVNGIATIGQEIKGLAQEHTPFHISGTVDSISIDTHNATWGNAALHDQLTAIAAQITALGSPMQTGAPITLPAIPPAGYGGLDGQSICDAVWFDVPSTMTIQAIEMLSIAAQFANLWGLAVDSDMTLGYFTIVSVIQPSHGIIFSYNAPTFDPGDILVGESFVACLTRQNPTFTIIVHFGAHGKLRLSDVGLTNSLWDTTFDEAQFLAYRALLFPTTSTTEAPVWPGLASVTLGTPVALDVVVDVPGPLKGVLIDLTSVPSRFGQFDYGSEVSYRHVGGITFTDDNGDAEEQQLLGFVHGLFVPKTMIEASAAHIRCTAGVVGTATPALW